MARKKKMKKTKAKGIGQGWHGQSPEHSLAARGIKIKSKGAFGQGNVFGAEPKTVTIGDTKKPVGESVAADQMPQAMDIDSASISDLKKMAKKMNIDISKMSEEDAREAVKQNAEILKTLLTLDVQNDDFVDGTFEDLSDELSEEVDEEEHEATGLAQNLIEADDGKVLKEDLTASIQDTEAKTIFETLQTKLHDRQEMQMKEVTKSEMDEYAMAKEALLENLEKGKEEVMGQLRILAAAGVKDFLASKHQFRLTRQGKANARDLATENAEAKIKELSVKQKQKSDKAAKTLQLRFDRIKEKETKRYNFLLSAIKSEYANLKLNLKKEHLEENRMQLKEFQTAFNQAKLRNVKVKLDNFGANYNKNVLENENRKRHLAIEDKLDKAYKKLKFERKELASF